MIIVTVIVIKYILFSTMLFILIITSTPLTVSKRYPPYNMDRAVIQYRKRWRWINDIRFNPDTHERIQLQGRIDELKRTYGNLNVRIKIYEK